MPSPDTSTTPMAESPKRDAHPQRYCLLVSSCDAYADCWEPFFTLLSRFWRPMEHEIVLNTETREFAFPGLSITCPRLVSAAGRKLAWSERLMYCLDAVPHEFVLYLQEDYFLKDDVDVAAIDELAELMSREPIANIGLGRWNRDRPRNRFLGASRDGTAQAEIPSNHHYLSKVDQRAEYRISAQATLWRTSALKTYLRRHETVWEFEWYGTRRAWRRADTFLYVNDEYRSIHGKEIFPYHGTGIVQGGWAREVVEDLFAAHNIDVDYSLRGFYDPNRRLDRPPAPIRAFRRLRSLR